MGKEVHRDRFHAAGDGDYRKLGVLTADFTDYFVGAEKVI
jgi:hypothetical protein